MSIVERTSWADQLKQAWCREFDVVEIDGGSAAVVTPFYRPDGDGMTVVVERRDDRWIVSDLGHTQSWFDIEGFDVTEGRHVILDRIGTRFRGQWDGSAFALELDSPPTVEDIAGFVHMLAEAHAIPEIQRRVDLGAERFRTTARARVQQRLRFGDRAQLNWNPPEDQQRLFPTDLWIPSERAPVAAFFAASDDKINQTVIIADQYRDWSLDLQPLILHRNLRSRAIDRAAFRLGNENVVSLPVDQQTRFVMRAAERRLEELGVELAAA
ncbi:MAG: DUF1828 domain-containing protein [Ilumatobacter sp.]|uniref:DUF1828 domain-containing protein n=1 Tax=Ilumatobacter sp. TaxID=1967498 RepID=UPI00260CBEB5|nr:DUF1828 domain-containing protein [Ilumatobacter sp.]MDJ0767136.1 DUF1828 domain-containing protein [Ilumatobacter sp.]